MHSVPGSLCEKVNDRRAKCGHVKNAKIWQRWITVEVLNGHSKLPNDLSTIHVESESYVDRSELDGRFDILVEWKLFLSVWQFLIAFCGSLIIRSKYYILYYIKYDRFLQAFPSFRITDDSESYRSSDISELSAVCHSKNILMDCDLLIELKH